MSKIERRFSEGVTADGRTLAGTVIPYGSEGKIGNTRERFEPGAFGDVSGSDVILNRQHQRHLPLARSGGGLTLTDSTAALAMSAELPETRDCEDTIALVRAGVLKGLSVEFRAVRERRDKGVRVIEKATLVGIAVVDRPAYADAAVQARETDAPGAGGRPQYQWWA